MQVYLKGVGGWLGGAGCPTDIELQLGKAAG